MPLVTLITTGIEFRSEKAQGFTSCRVTVAEDERFATDAEKLAAHLVAAIDPGRKTPRDKRADFALVLDDLELFNVDQPNVVVNAFRSGVRRHLQRTYGNAMRGEHVQEQLRRRASFHLLAPMLETYFFADPGVLEGIPVTRIPHLPAGQDTEEFATDDDAYQAAIANLPDIRSGTMTWVRDNWYTRHPKHYLKFLMSPTPVYDPDTRIYREAKQGTTALRELSPQIVLANSRHVTFLRSLIADLSLALQVDLPADIRGETAAATSRWEHGENVLRNC